jgi:type IV pilus assembly protein PilV
MFLTQKSKGFSVMPRKYMQGVTMIEVLVSMLVLSLGLLGVAGLQNTSLRSNQSAYFRSQATAIASDIMDRMRSNPDGVANGHYDAIDSANLPNDPACIDTANGCNAADLAAHDARDWALNVLSVLPTATGTVVVDNMGTAGDASDDVFIVTVNWSDLSEHVSKVEAAGLSASEVKDLAEARKSKSLTVRFQV